MTGQISFMKCKLPFLFVILFLSTRIISATAQSTVFTYQGHITDNGTNFSGTGQFQFALVTSTNFNHQAIATANLGGVSPNYFVSSCTVNSSGNGYISPPPVTIFGGGGSGATASASISGGVVATINVLTPGSGYTNVPTVSIAHPPANISYVTFWSNDGTSVAGSEPTTAESISVTNGLFTVVLGDTTLAGMAAIDASVFSHPNLQLQIWFNDGFNGFAALSPAQNLTQVPYAVQAVNANSASNLLGTLPPAQLSGPLNLTQLPSAVVTINSSGVNLTGSFNGDGSGLYNTVTTKNFVSAYDLSSQSVLNANTFQAITFGLISYGFGGWTYSSGSFTCGQTGQYLVEYSAEVATTTNSTTTISLHAVENGTEYVGSQSSVTLSVANQPAAISKGFLIVANEGDSIQIQFTGSNTNAELVAGNGAGTTKTSATMEIIRIE